MRRLDQGATHPRFFVEVAEDLEEHNVRVVEAELHDFRVDELAGAARLCGNVEHHQLAARLSQKALKVGLCKQSSSGKSLTNPSSRASGTGAPPSAGNEALALPREGLQAEQDMAQKALTARAPHWGRLHSGEEGT